MNNEAKVKETAEAIGVGVRTIYRWVERTKADQEKADIPAEEKFSFPFRRTRTGKLRFNIETVKEWYFQSEQASV